MPAIAVFAVEHAHSRIAVSNSLCFFFGIVDAKGFQVESFIGIPVFFRCAISDVHSFSLAPNKKRCRAFCGGTIS